MLSNWIRRGAGNDAVLRKAIEPAREAALALADDPSYVGEHVSVEAEDERLVTHFFDALVPGYVGWVWSVTLSRAPRGRDVQVCEASLVPGDGALLAPAWVPWAERIRPGDVDSTIIVPKNEDDARLMPGYQATGHPDLDELAIWELGLGRARVLAPVGKDDAVERWYRGSHGPTAPSAVASSAACASCAFFWPLSGSMRQVFGACTNEWSPSDGMVVSVDHGCGAHSETDVDKGPALWPAALPVFDTDAMDPMELGAPAAESVPG